VLDWLVGPLSSEDFALEQFYPIGAGVLYKFTPQGFNSIIITPTPTKVVTLKFKYISTNWLLPPVWTTGESISSVDVYRSYLDNVYIVDTLGTTGTTPPTHLSGNTSDGAVSWTYYNEPYITIINDNDIPVVDSQALESGFISRLKETLQQPNQADEIRYLLRGKAGFGNVHVGKTRSMFGKVNIRRNPSIVGF